MTIELTPEQQAKKDAYELASLALGKAAQEYLDALKKSVSADQVDATCDVVEETIMDGHDVVGVDTGWFCGLVCEELECMLVDGCFAPDGEEGGN